MEKPRKKPPPPPRDPPYLADLMRYHPQATREELLEMIRAFGG
jgi:hypothetical protein